VLLAPFAVFGTVVHYPAYRLAGYLSRRLARQEQDVLSTFKIISAMLFFPLTWIVSAAVSWAPGGWAAGIAAMIVTPLCGYIAVRFVEEIDRFSRELCCVGIVRHAPPLFVRLLAERATIHREIWRLRMKPRR